MIDVLYRRPQTISEACVTLHRRDAIPVWWGYSNVGAVIRRLHRRGALTRLDHQSCSRSVLWWS